MNVGWLACSVKDLEGLSDSQGKGRKWIKTGQNVVDTHRWKSLGRNDRMPVVRMAESWRESQSTTGKFYPCNRGSDRLECATGRERKTERKRVREPSWRKGFSITFCHRALGSCMYTVLPIYPSTYTLLLQHSHFWSYQI